MKISVSGNRVLLLFMMLMLMIVSSVQAQDTVTIKWWDFPRAWAEPGTDEDPSAWNKMLVEAYMEANPNVNIEFTTIDWVEGPNKLNVALIAGEGPDVMYGFPALFGRMLALDVLAPITPALEVMGEEEMNDFYPAALDFVYRDGDYWAFPWYYNAEGEYAINMTIVEEAGALDLVPQAPDYSWTPEELLELAQACTFTRDDGEQVYGIVFATNQATGIDIWPTWSFARMFGYELYDSAEEISTFADDGGAEALQFMYDLVEVHEVAPPGTGGLTNEDRDDLWNRQQACILINGGVEQQLAIAAGIESGTIEGPFEVIPVLPPAEEDVDLNVAGGVGVQMVFDNGDQARLNAALDFTAWLTNSENLLVFKDLSPLTARASSVAALQSGDDPVTAWRMEYVLPSVLSYSSHPQDLLISDAWMQAIQSLYAGERTAEEAAQYFQDEANRLLAEEVE